MIMMNKLLRRIQSQLNKKTLLDESLHDNSTFLSKIHKEICGTAKQSPQKTCKKKQIIK